MTTNLRLAPGLRMSGALRLFPPTVKPALPKSAEELKQFWSFMQSLCVGRGSSVRIATRHGLDGPGIESRSGRDSPHPSRRALGPTQRPIQWVPDISPG